jgi:hypothetical protein
MARPANKTTGKAIADIKALYFLKHVNGAEPIIKESLDNDAWFPVLSLRGTVNAGQDAPSIEKINVDQFDAPIGIITEPGDFTFEAQLPEMTYESLSKWLAGDDIEACYDDTTGEPIMIDGRQLMGINLNGDVYEVSVLIQTRTGASIIFSNAQVALTFAKEDKVFLFRLTGQILAASNTANKMLYIASENAISVTPEESSAEESESESSSQGE